MSTAYLTRLWIDLKEMQETDVSRGVVCYCTRAKVHETQESDALFSGYEGVLLWRLLQSSPGNLRLDE